MKCFLFFFFALFIGFFDFLLFCCFISLFVLFVFLDIGSFWFGGNFFRDNLSFFLLYLTGMIFFFCYFSSLSDFWNNNYYFSYCFVLRCIFFLLLISFTCLNAIIFYICFELIFMFIFIFVIMWGYRPERVQASFYIVFYTIVVSFPFLVYIIAFEDFLYTLKFCMTVSFSLYWWFFILFVFMVKLPVYIVHLWLPKAHVEAPVSGSIVLAGVLLKLGGYGFIRFNYFLSFSLSKFYGYLFSIGLVGGLIRCFLCLRQSDIKSFVAYSSICHIGFGLGGIYSYSYYGYAGGLYIMIGHGFCSSCLFYILYVLYKRFHTRRLFLLKGLGFVLPSVILVWFVFSIINMGVPPSFSFISEIFILTGVNGQNFFSCLIRGIFLFLAGIYGIFLYVVSCHGFTIIEGTGFSVNIREYTNFYGHFFPLLFLCFTLNFFFV